MKTDHEGFLQFPTLKYELTRAEVKMFRHMLNQIDVNKLSDDEIVLLRQFFLETHAYLLESERFGDEKNRLI